MSTAQALRHKEQFLHLVKSCTNAIFPSSIGTRRSKNWYLLMSSSYLGNVVIVNRRNYTIHCKFYQ